MPADMNRVHAVIHGAATAAAAVASGLAQLPGADAPFLVGIQTAMIQALAEVHGVPASRQMVTTLLARATATTAGRGISQYAVGWVPGYGNAVNAATAGAVTEAIGWAAHHYFDAV
jgi:uncharacterized protein (DUF697 family)